MITKLATRLLAFVILALWFYVGFLLVVIVLANVFGNHSIPWMAPVLHWLVAILWPTFPLVGFAGIAVSGLLRCRGCNAVIFPILINNGPAIGREARMFSAVKAGVLERDLECPRCHASVFSGGRA